MSTFLDPSKDNSGLTGGARLTVDQDCGLQRAPGGHNPQGQASDSKPVCSPALQAWVDCAADLFHGKGGLYGFIVTNDNSYTGSYGFESLYEAIPSKVDISQVDIIKGLKGKRNRLIGHEFGFIREKDIYSWFADLVNRQNNTGMALVSPEGKRVIAQNGRFCNKRGKRSLQVQNVFKEGIGEITDCILLTLTTHEKEVLAFMPENSNFSPVEYAIVNIGDWISGFLSRFRQWQRTRSLPWEFVGWTLEFQEGEKNGENGHHGDFRKMHNGFPHVHMIFRGKWIGKIQEIAKLWPYCEPQGVDYMDKAKYERKLRADRKLSPQGHVSGVRLINYITAYVSKCSKAVIVKDGKVWVHKGYAWLAFCGGRMFNVARDYKKGNARVAMEKRERTFMERYSKGNKSGWVCEGVQVISGEMKEGA